MLMFQRAGGLLRPGEESIPLQGNELLGVITSHGPPRESYSPSRKSRGTAATAIAPPAACATLSAEGMREALPSAADTAALLRRRVPGCGAEVGPVEGAATLPGDGGGQAETQRSKPPLPGARQKPETARTRGS